LGELAFPTPKSLLDKLKSEIGGWHLGYTQNQGLPELRDLVAETSGLDVTGDQVCITVGAEQAIFLTIMALVNPEDEVLVPNPGFPAYPAVVKAAEGKAKYYPLLQENNFSMRFEDIKNNITEITKAIVLNSPNNPTGAVYSSKELKKLADFLEHKKIVVISDEVYRDIYFEERPDSIANYLSNSAVIHSLSKSYSMTGWRLGWCIAPRNLIKPLVALHQMNVTCAPVVSQKIALSALKGFAEEEQKHNIEELRKRRDFAMICLKKYTSLDFIRPAGAFYIFVDISSKMPKYGSSIDISLRILEKERVITIPGLAFGSRGDGYLRISFAPDSDQLKEGIRRIGRFFS
jgi:aspartate/methionine/tyrosine aminotransferase